MPETPIPVQQKAISLDELFKQKGEIVTQLEIAQSRLQMINSQISALLNQPK